MLIIDLKTGAISLIKDLSESKEVVLNYEKIFEWVKKMANRSSPFLDKELIRLELDRCTYTEITTNCIVVLWEGVTAVSTSRTNC